MYFSPESHILSILQIKKHIVKKCLSGSPIFSSFVEKEPKNINEGEKICVFADEKFIGCYVYIGKGDLIAKPEFVFN